jgi:hypothetical protein
MDNASLLLKARREHSKNAKARRDATVFVLSYRGGGTARILGYTALAATLNIKEASIPVLLSKGCGGTFTLTRPNPLSGEPDVLVVARVPVAKPKPRRGRPPKAQDWERLGSEAPGAPRAK